MKHNKLVLTLLLVLTFGVVQAHSDFWKIKDFGNVKVRIKTGYNYEEIKKIFIYGQLVEKLAAELNYTDPIFLDFNHHYVRNCEPDYFVSFDRGAIEYTWGGARKPNPIMEEKSIVIRQVARRFDAKSTLNLVEYAINNLSDIKSNQKTIDYEKNYCQWRIQTSDTIKIKEISQNPPSTTVAAVMSNKIPRPEEDFDAGISYHFKDGLFCVDFKGYNQDVTTLITLKDIYQFSRPNNTRHAFIFDTDSTFYFVDSRKVVSKRYLIQDFHGNSRPFYINHIGGRKYSLYFWYFMGKRELQTKDRTLIFIPDRERLIQNFDELIDKE